MFLAFWLGTELTVMTFGYRKWFMIGWWNVRMFLKSCILGLQNARLLLNYSVVDCTFSVIA